MLSFFRKPPSALAPLAIWEEAESLLRAATSPVDIEATLDRLPRKQERSLRGQVAYWIVHEGRYFSEGIVRWILKENALFAHDLARREPIPEPAAGPILEYLMRRYPIGGAMVRALHQGDEGWESLSRLVAAGLVPLGHPALEEAFRALGNVPNHAPSRRAALAHPDLPLSLLRQALPGATHGSAESDLWGLICERGSLEELRNYWARLVQLHPLRAVQALGAMGEERRAALGQEDVLPLFQSPHAEVRLAAALAWSSHSAPPSPSPPASPGALRPSGR